MVYANPSEYAAHTGQDVTLGVHLLLERASRMVDQALLTSVYDPDDPEILAALRTATCEQASFLAEAGETGTGAPAQYQDVQIGSVRLGRGGASSGSSSRLSLASQAWMILQQAGLTGHEPRTYC